MMNVQCCIETWNCGEAMLPVYRRHVHPYILKYFPPSKLQGKRVLLPFCKQISDLAYFRTHAGHVTAVKPDTATMAACLDQMQRPFVKHGNRYHAEGFTLIDGEVSLYTLSDLQPFNLIYDRTGLVRLPVLERRRYSRTLNDLLCLGGQQFLHTLEFTPHIDAPPYSITPFEVNQFYGANHWILHLEQTLLTHHNLVPNSALQFLEEHGFLLTKHSDSASPEGIQ